MIEVNRKTQQEFTVIVEEGGARTAHTVTLDDNYYQALTQSLITKEELIRKSFEFLLRRESKESVLSKFNLKVINKYFPEFEKEIKTKEAS